MDFVIGQPETLRGFNVIWVIVDRLIKSAHFLPIKTSFSMERLAKLYMGEIVKLHSIPASVVSDRDTRYVSQF